MLLTAVIIALSGCKKIGKTYDVFFYTGSESSFSPLILFLDNKNIGEIPVLETTLSSDNETLINHALHVKLRAGKYDLEVRDQQGKVKCSGTLIFRFKKFSGATGVGTLEHVLKGKTLVTRIYTG